MKLIEIQIEDYKSIKKIKWELQPKLTSLVGQNESGKSNLIEVLNFIQADKMKTLSYKTHTNRSSDRYLNTQIPFIKATFKVDSKSKKWLSENLAPYCPDKDIIKEFKNINYLVVQSEERDGDNNNYYFENEESYYKLSYFIPNSGHYPEVIRLINEIQSKIIRLDGDYVDNFQLTVQQVITNADPNAALIKLMKLTGVDDLSKMPTENQILNKYLSRLNKKLNANFTRKYYSQDISVELKIVHNSGQLFLEISDNSDAEYEIHERSDGFKYFFGLLIEAASISREGGDVIFVLDEPGGKLHPSGQRDLLKYLEELSEKFRVIYTTHSPFLINRLYPNRVRVIERDKKLGTRFKFKGFSKNWRPLRSALGLNLSDSFYYSEKALIVEGPEDIIYIGSLLKMFNLNNEVSINTDIFSFIDSGGEGNLPSMVQIMIEEERPIMVLMDSDSQRTYNKIDKKRTALKSGAIVLNQINDFRNKAVSIEDLLPKELLKNALNQFLTELINDGSLELIPTKNNLLNEIISENSIYKDSIAPFIKENFKNPTKSEDDWIKEKVPISKVGIARYFEKIIDNEQFNYKDYKAEFGSALKLVKTVILKLKLKL